MFEYGWGLKYGLPVSRADVRESLARRPEFSFFQVGACADFVLDTMLDIVEQRVAMDNAMEPSAHIPRQTWPLISWSNLQQINYGAMDVYSNLIGNVAAFSNKSELRKALRTAGVPKPLGTLMQQFHIALSDIRTLRHS